MADPDTLALPAGPNAVARRRRRTRLRRALGSILALVVFAGLFLLVTSFTGFPGPGPVRRFPTADLQDLADRINDNPDCNGPGSIASDGRTAPAAASVDWLRSRVHLARPWTVLLSPSDAVMAEDLPDQPDGPHSSPASGCSPYRTSPAMS